MFFSDGQTQDHGNEAEIGMDEETDVSQGDIREMEKDEKEEG